MISPNSISQVLEVAHVEDVINDFVSLKRRGVNMLGLCPFHNEKTPSFTVSPTKNLYKCFGCGKGGNAVSFIMEHENYSFPEAIRYLAKKYGIELEETKQTNEELQKTQQKESLFIINEFAKKFFIDTLKNTDEGKSVGLSYFRNRGILPGTIDEFHLGYSPMDSKALINHAQKEEFKSEYLEELGLKSKGGYDFFRARMIFPITNLSGKVIAFGGRTLSSDKKVPKYLNSPESEIYNKSKSLYGIFQAKNQIRREDNCYLVEGYTDVLSLSQNGLKNVVASSGTSLTAGQLRIIKRFCSKITFLYDGDGAGQKAAIRGLSIALDEGFDVNIIPLDAEEDPDSLVQRLGSTAFLDYVKDKKVDFIIHQAHKIKRVYEKLPIEKSGAIRELIESLAFIKDTIKRSVYVKEISNILELAEAAIMQQLNKNIKKLLAKKKKEKFQDKSYQTEPNVIVEKNQNTQKSAPTISGDYYQEKDIIRILLNDGHKKIEEHDCTVASFIIENVKDVIDTFSSEAFQQILNEFKKRVSGDHPLPNLDHFISHNNPKVQEVALEMAESPFSYANWSENGVELQTQKNVGENHEKDIEQALLRFILRKMNDQIVEIQDQIKNSQTPPEKKLVLIKTYHKILDHRKSIAHDLGTIVL